MSTSFYSSFELKRIGLKKYGENVLISKKASLYNIEEMEFGNNIRIDDFCILSGKIVLHNFIHISAFCALYGKAGIEINDYSGLSPRCTVFSISDDFSGDYLIGPMVPVEMINLKVGKVIIAKHVQLGAGCVVLPGITIDEGTAVGAMSLVNKYLPPWGIYAGIPARLIKPRKQGLLNIIH
jgi:acetyltransferase-like isoleucine patch superfamily enzyme